MSVYSEKFELNNKNEVFDFLISNLKSSILTWSYFVNWDKVFTNTRKVEIALNTLNYLIGKEDFDLEFINLIKEQPQLIEVIPLLAVRDGNNTKEFEILVNYKNNRFEYRTFKFTKGVMLESDLQLCLEFVIKSGIKNLLVDKKIKNLVDYILGVEAGLDSNGRKNRSGSAMELIVEHFIADFCERHKFEYLTQATAEKIYAAWGVSVPVDKSSRRYDFAVKTSEEILLFETNYYGGPGSKLKSTAGEYRDLYKILNDAGFRFIWITDGLGWNSAKYPLRETFDNNDYIFNLAMLENNILDELI
ncbi:MAG: type II restriction endonuclease [Sphingobacteriaceae bacterium]|nr:type II restriction endonuclease [Sphingobacteriaceae bacterium]